MSKNKVLKLAALTLVFMSLVGWVVIEFIQDESLWDLILGYRYYPWYYQVGIGAVYGALSAVAGWQIVRLPQLREIKGFFSEMIGGIGLNQYQIIFVSFCAGTGEEILFRGAIQPYLGIWLTSILFVMIHGYLNPRNIPMTFFGIFMVIVVGGMGYMTIKNGLLSAIVAHMVIDWILLTFLGTSWKKMKSEQTPDDPS